MFKELENYFRFQNTPKGIKAIVSKRNINVGFHNQKESQIKKNREKILAELGLRIDQLICAQQIHSNGVCIVGRDEKGRGAIRYSDALADIDALITKEKNIAIAVFCADCLPIFLIDKKKDIIAIVHAGWKSTKKAIVKNTIFAMKQVFDTQPKDVLVYFGPAIRRCCFEVGEEFLGYFKRGIYRSGSKIFLDTAEVNYLQLREVGVIEKNIFDSKICTVCSNDKFFSYRKEKESCGRQMALIVRQ